MNLIKHHWLPVMLLAFSIPGAGLAETATVAAVVSAPTGASAAVDAAPAERMELIQTMSPTDRMSMMLLPGLPPDGGPGRMGQRQDRSCQEELTEQRLDSIEIRMEKMQMMLRMMLDR